MQRYPWERRTPVRHLRAALGCGAPRAPAATNVWITISETIPREKGYARKAGSSGWSCRRRVVVGYAQRTIICRIARKRYAMRTLPGCVRQIPNQLMLQPAGYDFD